MEECIKRAQLFMESRSVTPSRDELSSLVPKSLSEDQLLELINWVQFVPAYLQNSELFLWSLSELQKALSHSSYLVGHTHTLADLVVWVFLESSSACQSFLSSEQTTSPCVESNFCHIRRYYNHISSLDFTKRWVESIRHWRSKNLTTTVHKTDTPTSGTSSAEMRFEVGGKFGHLPGAKVGQVVVRFPPEASGYLHIGHAKAALLNQHYRDIFKGRLILRFDDTNPSKEKAFYEESILSDLPRLGVQWDVRSHTSDHFDLMLRLCEQLIRDGKAYVDDTDGDTMKIERENRKPSVRRDNSVEQNLAWWDEMKRGTDFGLQCCVRAKIDMNSNNGALRDPTVYRCKRDPHVRTGTKYSVYPLYDFACPIVDSVEGVTHALRTSEYNDRNDQYAWFCEALGLRCPIVIDYSRLALQNTILSKRKLAWFVDEGLVDGWDDPRMPTVSGILRHGMTAEGLRQFVLAQGSSRSSAQMEWDKIWAFNKKVIDPIAPRFTGLLMDPSVPLRENAPHGLVPVNIRGQDELTEKQVPVHPKNEQLGQRTILIGPRIFVEHSDALCFKTGENVTFINWGNCRVLKVNCHGDFVTEVEAELNLDDKDYKKTPKITWLADPGPTGPALTPTSCLLYGHLLTKAVISKDDDFKLLFNHSSKLEQCLLGDHDLRTLKKGDIIQLQRRGYYICDAPYDPKCAATGYESPCVLIQIPEGTAKPDVSVSDQVQVEAKPPGGSSRPKPKPVALTKEEEAKAAERQRRKEEKKEARKEGRAKRKQCVDGEHTAKNQQATAEITGNHISCEKVNHPVSSLIKPDEHSTVSSQQTKKQTRLALEAQKETEFAEWYSQLITKSELLDYYDISGCYILRPWAYSMWQTIQRFMDSKLHPLGVENAYFPMFVSKSALAREKSHLADFSPEVAWVTKSGDTDLIEPVAIRPTSETIIYPAFAKWIKSHRDLPLRVNQWSNVVRWEFKHPQPFLRTREFLWQEGHTAHANKQDAEAEVLTILDLYAQVYEELLAVPVVKGRKTEKEKFAGADYTTTLEAFVSATGRAIQGATSHHLGQNFSRMCDVTYDHPTTGMPEYVYQNSWGLTTRTLGVLIMTHGDNKGLVLPPRIAPLQIVIVPCGITSKSTTEERETLISTAREVTTILQKDPAGYRVRCDDRTHVSPGWKFNHWELKGVPIRLEIGPQEVAERSVCAVLRYNADKLQIPIDELGNRLPLLLDTIHADMLNKARSELSSHILPVNQMDELRAALDAKSLAVAAFCCDAVCEEHIRNESAQNIVVEPGAPSMGAKSLCIPFAFDFNSSLPCGTPALGTKCIGYPRCTRPAVSYTMFGRSY